MNDEQLTQRMRAASDAIEMSDSAQAQHLEAISAALAAGADASDGTVVPLSSAKASRRRRIVASVVAAAVIAPTGLAAASESSVPGDTLYPVKQLSERVLVLFDSEVIARHRIEEIEALDTAGRFDPDLYDDAREALTELGEDHPLWERLASSTEGAGDSDDSDDTAIGDDDRSELEPADETAVDTEITDQDIDDDTPSMATDAEDEGAEDNGADEAEDDEAESDEAESDEAESDEGDDDSETEGSTPSEDDSEDSDGSDSGDGDPEDEEDDPGDDQPSEDT